MKSPCLVNEDAGCIQTHLMNLLELLAHNSIPIHSSGLIVIVVMPTYSYNIETSLSGSSVFKEQQAERLPLPRASWKSQCSKVVSRSCCSALGWSWMPWVLNFPVDRCVPGSSYHVYSSDWILEDRLNTCLVESQVFNLGKEAIAGNHPVPIPAFLDV